MPKRAESYRDLDGVHARNEWLSFMVRPIELVARQRLLDHEKRLLHGFPSTPDEQKALRVHLGLEEKRIHKIKDQMNLSLDLIEEMAKDYLKGFPASNQLPPLDGVEAGRHLPVVTLETQSLLWDMTLTRARPEEAATVGFSPDALQHGPMPRTFAGGELGRLVKAQLGDSEGEQTSSSTDLSLAAVFVHMNEFLKIVPGESMKPQQRSDKRIAQRLEPIHAHLAKVMKLYKDGSRDEQKEIDRAAQELFNSYVPILGRSIAGFMDELNHRAHRARGQVPADVMFRAGRAPAEEVMGPGGLSGIANLQIATKAAPSSAKENLPWGSPIPAMKSLLSSKSSNGSGSITDSGPHTRN